MPSTYTTNLGIEKIESGAQTGVWGTTTNTNLDIIDQGINGVHTETLAVPGDSSSPNTLPITDGATSAGRNKLIEFVDGGDLGATAYVQLTPNDAEKIVFMRNSLSGGRSVIVFQGTYNASNDFEIPNGKDVVLKFDGAGVGATVTQVFEDLLVTAFTATTTDINGGTIDGTAVGGSTPAAGAFTTLEATSLDSTPIGGTTPAAGSFTTLAATGNTTLDGTAVVKQGLPIINESGTSKTLALTDNGGYIVTSNGSAVTITVPPNSSVAFPTGSEVVVFQGGAGQVTFAAGSGVTIRSKDSNLKITAQYAAATLKKIATDEWHLLGDLEA